MKIARILSISLMLLFLAACSGLMATEAPISELTIEESDDEAQTLADTPLSNNNNPVGISVNPQEANRQAASPASGGAPIEQTSGESAMSVMVAMPTVSAAEPQDAEQEEPVDPNTTEGGTFEDYGVNPFVETSQDNLSTFGMDVDTASYTYARTSLLDYGQLPNPAAIRPEEFINYYPTNYAPPTDGTAFAIQMDAAPSPFSAEGQILLRVGIQGEVIAAEDRSPALLIFVIDISGSMNQPNRLELAKQSLEILTAQLREDDRVGIVVYSDSARVVLDPTPASEQDRIISAIRSLQVEGSTYVEEGLRLGYDMALANRVEGQINRVIIVSDGVANVGATGPDAILQTVRQGVESGITLSTIGFGMGDYNDTMMERLANDGNGNYYYVDNLREARRIFAFNLSSTLQVIGYDARIQVEFSPDTVASYRLIGYENRAIADERFRDDTVDAGEVGAGHSVTALYELQLVEGVSSGNLAIARLRYEDAPTHEVVEISQNYELGDVFSSFEAAPADFQLLVGLAEFSEILRESPYGDSQLADILAVVQALAQSYPDADELAHLIRAAMDLQQ